MSFLDNLDWRDATKEFDKSKKVSSKNLDKILTSIQYSPSSYGLQTYHVYVVTDDKLKSKIKVASFLQKQVDTCSHLIIFCALTDKNNLSKRVDNYTKIQSKINKTPKIKLEAMRLMMKSTIKKRSAEDNKCWAAKQNYIALGFAMAACAELKIDSCPMEGFDKKSVDKILKLPKYLESVLMLPIGYRKEAPKRKKVRFSKEDLFTNL